MISARSGASHVSPRTAPACSRPGPDPAAVQCGIATISCRPLQTSRRPLQTTSRTGGGQQTTGNSRGPSARPIWAGPGSGNIDAVGPSARTFISWTLRPREQRPNVRPARQRRRPVRLVRQSTTPRGREGQGRDAGDGDGEQRTVTHQHHPMPSLKFTARGPAAPAS